jgi:hypothetical protein
MLVKALLLPACFQRESIFGANSFSRPSTSEYTLQRTCVTQPLRPSIDSAQGNCDAHESYQCLFCSYVQRRCLAATCRSLATTGSTICTSETCSRIGIGVLMAFNKTQPLGELVIGSTSLDSLLPLEFAMSSPFGVGSKSATTSLG